MDSMIEGIDRAQDADQTPRNAEPVRAPVAPRCSPQDIRLQDNAPTRNGTMDHRPAVEIPRLNMVVPAVQVEMRDNVPRAYSTE